MSHRIIQNREQVSGYFWYLDEQRETGDFKAQEDGASSSGGGLVLSHVCLLGPRFHIP